MKQENEPGTSPQGEELQREFLAGLDGEESPQFYLARALCLVAGEVRALRYGVLDKLEDIRRAVRDDEPGVDR